MSENKKSLKDKLTASVIGALLSGAALLILMAQLLAGTPNEKPLGVSAILGASCRTNGAASTSPASLGAAGTATSTLDCPVGGADVLRVNAWFIASSTQTNYRILVSKSNNDIDVYQEGGSLLSLTANATSTNLRNFTEFNYQFASSTKETQIEVNFSGTGTTSAKLLTFEIPTKGANLIRLTTYLQTTKLYGVSTTSDSGMFWLEGVPSAQ